MPKLPGLVSILFLKLIKGLVQLILGDQISSVMTELKDKLNFLELMLDSHSVCLPYLNIFSLQICWICRSYVNFGIMILHLAIYVLFFTVCNLLFSSRRFAASCFYFDLLLFRLCSLILHFIRSHPYWQVCMVYIVVAETSGHFCCSFAKLALTSGRENFWNALRLKEK